ncbi:hypothetical protein WJX81_004598 [Elliptochloris bilobata]|uniref:Malectin domain-containing protein n=1 Tax=Elliptochloris bilobata TaxID=381761 RepID=A0AAW1S2K0_9CHLO
MAGAFPADPAARYAVRLFFSDYSSRTPGVRVFDLTIAGSLALSDFDIVSAAGGVLAGVVRTFLVWPTADGLITLDFSAVAGLPEVAALAIWLDDGASFLDALSPAGLGAPMDVRGEYGAGRGGGGSSGAARVPGQALFMWLAVYSDSPMDGFSAGQVQLVGAKATSTIGQDIVPNSYVLWVASNPDATTFSVTLAPDGIRDVAGNALIVPAATIIPVMATSSASASTLTAAGPASSAAASAPAQAAPTAGSGTSAAAVAQTDSGNTKAPNSAHRRLPVGAIMGIVVGIVGGALGSATCVAAGHFILRWVSPRAFPPRFALSYRFCWRAVICQS